MAIKTCPNGHKYNSDDNDTCPYCERTANGGSFEWSEFDDNSSMSLKTEPLINRSVNAFEETLRTEPLPSQGFNYTDSRTMPITTPEANSNTEKNEYRRQPVVGWLVCIEGPDKGKDFGLHGAKSTIGRSPESSIVLSDPKISRKGFPALIVYDDRKSHRFYITSGDASSTNNVELEGNMLLGQSVIDPYNEIRIEDTVLVFVPFCGTDFYWESK